MTITIELKVPNVARAFVTGTSFGDLVIYTKDNKSTTLALPPGSHIVSVRESE
jgi:hypothetical protein